MKRSEPNRSWPGQQAPCRKPTRAQAAVGSRRALATLAIAALLGCLSLPSACFADRVWSHKYDSPRDGLRLELSGSGAVGAGYLPIQVTIETLPVLPSPVERRIQFALVLERDGTRDRFTREIVLPSGATRVTATVPITMGKSCYWSGGNVQCSEGGQALRDLSGWWPISCPQPATGDPELYPSILFVDRDAPPVDQRMAMVNRLLSQTERPPAVLPRFLPLTTRLCGDYGGATLAASNGGGVAASLRAAASNQTAPTAIQDADTLVSLPSLENVGLLAPSALPEEWLSLSNYDLIFIPWPELRDLAQTAPKNFAALRTWVSAGGILCVHGVGERFAAQRPLETALRLSPTQRESATPAPRSSSSPNPLSTSTAGANATASAGSAAVETLPNIVFFPGWREMNRRWEPKSVPLFQIENAWGMMMGSGSTNPQWEDVTPRLPAPFTTPNPPTFDARVRDLGLGLVVALDTLDPWEADLSNWGQLFHFIGESRFRPLKRLGVSRLSENPDFGTFVIPGVGRPPITLFLCLITAFAIALGPVNYFVLKARRRLYWMFVTVPAAAFLATFGLLGYAILADGLGVRTRIASLTHVDQIAEVASSMSRQTYFAGIAPSGGLQFPADALVHPIERRSELEDPQRRPTHEVAWSDRQVYKSGYMPPRTMTEWLVVAPQPSSLGLRIQMAADGSGTCRVRNELGVGLHALVVCDEQGRHYFARGLASNGEVKLDELAWEQIRKQWRDALPKLPPATSGWDTTRANRWMRWVRTTTSGSFQTSLLDQHRRTVLAGQPFDRRRGYLALAEQPVATPLGVTPDEVVHDLHIVVGAW